MVKHIKLIKKILLIQPPAFALKDKSDMNPNAPLGIAYIGSVLEAAGYEVMILDAFVEGLENEIPVDNERVLIGLTPAEIAQRIRDYSPDVVGVSSLFTIQRRNSHKVCEVAKSVSQNIIVVMGGPHPTAEPEMVLEDRNVDYVVLGEGEETMPELLNRLNAKKDISDIDGLCLRCNGKVVVNKKNRFIEDLDSIPFPARHLLPMEKYFRFKKSHGVNRLSPYASIVTSRGCPFGCTFCSTHTVWGRRYRFRSARNVLEEIKYLVKNYGIKELLFEDDNLTLNGNRALEIFQGMIDENLGLIWRTPNGVAVSTLDNKLLDKMKESGCYQLGFAIESGNQRVLDNIIKKPLNLDEIPKLVRHSHRIGIDVILFLVVGMPGETIEDMKETFRFSRRLGIYDNQHISIATPYPGSELYRICKERNLFAKEFNYDRLSIRNANIETEEWSPDDILRLVERERRKNYLLCSFRNPVLFAKALVPPGIKKILKKHIKRRKAIDEYSS